jgi:signal transduction histidine kinase
MFNKINEKSERPWMTGPEAEELDQARRVPRARLGSQTLLSPGLSPGDERPQALPDGDYEQAAVALRTLRELCHDLTGPATSIKLLTQVAAAESDPGPSMRARLRQISNEASRISDICGYFLDPPGGEGPADLHALAADAADAARWRYPGVIEVSAEAVSVAAHPVIVGRILTNLIDNACRAAGPGGQVLLTVRREEDQARLVVADSGRGFGSGPSGTASLGLDIVAALVRRSGGFLRMDSGELGGMAVTVGLPRAVPQAASGPPPARPLVRRDEAR